MKIKKKIINFLLIFLFIVITYTVYYDIILNILSNSCRSIAGGLIEKDSSFLTNFISGYKKGENFMCTGYFNSLLKNSKLTLTIYILFLWLTLIPFISNQFELKFKYKNIFFIIGMVVWVLLCLFYTLNTRYLNHWIGG